MKRTTTNNAVAKVVTDKQLNTIATKLAENVTEKNIEVMFRVKQCGKNPFEMQAVINAPSKSVSLSGLASKTAFALADSLYSVCERALEAKEQHGYYLTSFRPKAVFTIIIETSNNISFYAVNTKGADSIRLVKNGKLISRALLAQKLSLLAEMSKANQNFASGIAFENKTLQLS